MSQDKTKDKAAKPAKTAKPPKTKAETETKKVEENKETKTDIALNQPGLSESQAQADTGKLPIAHGSNGATTAAAAGASLGLPETGDQMLPNRPADSDVVLKQSAGESEVQADAQVEKAPKREAEVETAPETDQEPDQEKVPGQDNAGLKPVRSWIIAQRLASWQSAALLRARGWTDDKRVSQADFDRALKETLNRPLGGRREGGRNGRRN
jgi:hypothetical protein